ncbi:UDP-N-acetylmuramate dehydrogenase [Prochlorococcus marinus]|uniref:UDP-N-acetylmuramate dehydrogenase n=1 Tax=Prochlorococcus marinus TaxID=1219 RepID=UPI0022B4FFFD|nr:UDP-N-acetylmuramate dehydrogenase [Prochlorococcus marinus]
MQNNNLLKLPIKALTPLSKLTTLRIGGNAQWLAEPRTINELSELILWAKNKNLSCNAFGAGSNLLISDNGIEGLTICLKKLQGHQIDPSTGIIEVLGGEFIPNLSRKVARHGLHGLEWAVGIPGTIGGAAVMNAGAQGSCIADRLISLKAISIKNGKEFEISNQDLNFSYRQSILQEKSLIVISARFQLDPGHDKEKLINITNQNLAHRLKTQPYHLPNCGSIFRNPEKFKAGKLIEQLGLKGLRHGGAEISSIHANFIINSNQATAKDVLELIEIIQKKIQTKHGFLLQPEIKKLGFN